MYLNSFLFLFIYSSALVPIFENIITLPDIPGGLLTTTLFLIIFSVFHANYFLGWKKTLVFFVITVIVSWEYEQLGTDSGLIYGNYYHTDVLGEKIGHVPIIIPLAWFMMIYPSYIIANLIVSKSPIIHENKILKIILLSVLSAGIMTAWDLLVDPVLSAPPGNSWIWLDGGAYFGVPIHNFLWWLLTTFTIYLICRIIEGKSKPIQTQFVNYSVILPVMAYDSMMITYLLPGEPPELIFIGPIAMGIPIIMALVRFKQNKKLVANN